MSGRRLQWTLEPSVLRWARERARLDVKTVAAKVRVRPDRVAEWERSGRISVAQADRLAHHTCTPVGFLYLPEPPEDNLPIPDFRTPGGVSRRRPSPNLIETVHCMQRRQAWMREELVREDAEPLGFVGAWHPNAEPERVAAAMLDALALSRNWATRERSWTAALRRLRNRAVDAGVLVFIDVVVGNNPHRRLAPDEFQGFALVDDYAPLVFVNGADLHAAQTVTLAHELAHLFIGETGVSRADVLRSMTHEIERFCARTAGEFLLPAEAEALQTHWTAYRQNAENGRRPDSGDGSSQSRPGPRIGRRFGKAVVRAAKEGRLLYREAYTLTGLRGDAFHNWTNRLDATT